MVALIVLGAVFLPHGSPATPGIARADSGFCGVRVDEGLSGTWYFYTWRNKCSTAHSFKVKTYYGRAATPCLNTLGHGYRTGTSMVYPDRHGYWYLVNC